MPILSSARTVMGYVWLLWVHVLRLGVYPRGKSLSVIQRSKTAISQRHQRTPSLFFLLSLAAALCGPEPVLGQCDKECTENTQILSCSNFNYPLQQCANIFWLNMSYSQIKSIPDKAFSGLALLEILRLSNNLIEYIPRGSFDNQRSMTELHLTGNHITAIPDKLFDSCSRMKYLHLNDNQITAIPDKLFDSCSRMEYLYLHSNQITAIPDRLFDSCSRMEYLILYNNHITTIQDKLFDSLSNMNVLDLATNMITYIHLQAFDALGCWSVRINYNPNPLVCNDDTCNNDKRLLSCTKCITGYVIDDAATNTNSATCYGPPFSLSPQNTNKATKIKALISRKQPLYTGVPVPTESADFFYPKENVFAGYKLSGDNIRFRLDFPPEDETAEISCGDIYLGDTLADGTENKIFYTIDQGTSGEQNFFDSREVHLGFKVTIAGSIFHFDGCQSQFGVSLGVYKFGDPTFTMLAGQQVAFGKNAVGVDGKPFDRMPDVQTCDFSANSYLKTPPLDVGSYVVVVQGRIQDADSGGLFELAMLCPSGPNTAAQRAPSTDPGGISINPSTGELSGAPQTIGHYSVNYTAVDSVGNAVVLASWDFEVKEQPDFKTTNVPFVMELVPLEGYTTEQPLLANLTINTTYRYFVANDRSLDDFVSGNVGSVSVRIAVSGDRVPNSEVLIDTTTGTFQVQPSTNYTATVELFAVDSFRGSTREVRLRSWTFSTLPADTISDLNGPNSRGCTNGNKVDIIWYDLQFTCGCYPGFAGDNCGRILNFTCEYGSPNAQGTRCEEKDCPDGCACDMSTGNNNFITVTCTGSEIPLSPLPVGTKTVDLTAVKRMQPHRLALLKLPTAFKANDGIIKTSPLNVTLMASPSTAGSSDNVCNPSENSWSDLAIRVCPQNSNCNVTCELGTYQSENGTTCRPCERGGFYSDRTGRVGEFSHCGACSRCVNGTFANTSGATNIRDCAVCPTGTDTSRFAGYQACPCLENFARTDRFGECTPCEADSGITCNNSYRALLPGYYWTFGSNESLIAYETFVADLQKDHDYDHSVSAYTGTLPATYECPRAASCLGGVNGSCAEGFAGPLCAVCDTGYGSSFGGCTKCASVAVNAVASSLCLLLLLGVLYWLWIRPVFKLYRDNGAAEPLTQSWGIATVILEDHYVITSQILVLFPFVPWRMAAAAETFLSGIRFLSQPFEGAVGVGCLTHFTVLDELFVFNILVALVLVSVFIFYCVGRVRIGTGCCSHTRTVAQLASISVGILCKALPTLFTYVLLKATVVLRPCHQVGDTEYVYADYLVVCNSGKVWDSYRTLAILDIIVIGLCLGGALIFNAYHHCLKNRNKGTRASRANHISDPSRFAWSTALRPITGAYRGDRSYWRLVDFTRVICLTSVIEVIAVDTSVQLFAAALFAVGFLLLAFEYTPFLWSNAIAEKKTLPLESSTTDDAHQVTDELTMSNNNRTYQASVVSTLLLMIFAAMLESGSRDPKLPNKTSLKTIGTLGLIVSALLPYMYIIFEYALYKVQRRGKSRPKSPQQPSKDSATAFNQQPSKDSATAFNPVFDVPEDLEI